MLICSASDHWATGLDSLTDLHPALGPLQISQTAPLTQRPDIGQESEEEMAQEPVSLVHFPKV